jgi:predicted metal-dependent hydrolase
MRDVDNKNYYFLGEPYQLTLLSESDAVQPVTLVNNELRVTMANPTSELIDALLSCWYKSHAQAQFTARCKILLPAIPWVNTIPTVRLRGMKSRWGSCSQDQEITLNYHLVKAPIECIDYVIVHELCHFLEMNHGPQFYRLLSSVLPDWKRRRKTLNAMTEHILPA